MKVIIINTAVLNTGDAAILVATIDILRQAFKGVLDISVYDQQAETAKRYYPDLRFRSGLYDQIPVGANRKIRIARVLFAALLWRTPLKGLGKWLAPAALHRSLDEFAAADMIVSAGGTYLVPHYRIFPKLLDMLVARAVRRPLILFTQSLGPFPDRRKGLLHFVLQGARAILVRDALSYRHLLDYGIHPDRIAECADAAFALAAPPADTLPAEGRRLRIAVSVRDWPHVGSDTETCMARYLDAVAETVRWLIERRNVEVTFLSTCQGISEYWTDDSAVAESVVARLAKDLRERVVIDRDFHDPKALIARLRTFDLVIATRMHVAILALGAGVPVVPIAYEFKTVELFRRLGLSNLVHDIETVNGETLRTSVEGLIAQRATIYKRLRPYLERERDSAFSAGSHIRDAVGMVS